MSHLSQGVVVNFHLADVGGDEVLPLVILSDKDIVLATLVRDDVLGGFLKDDSQVREGQAGGDRRTMICVR